MATTAPHPISFDEYLQQYPEDGRYELVDGRLVKMLPTRQHEDVADFLKFTLNDEVSRCKLNYKVSDRIMIVTGSQEGKEQGRHPDVSVVDLDSPIQLAVEVVSTNWEDDYVDKLGEYERLGIQEYWIVDYLAIGSRDYIGSPKEPTVSIHQLVEGKYQVARFQGSDRLISPTFPDLALTMEQILVA